MQSEATKTQDSTEAVLREPPSPEDCRQEFENSRFRLIRSARIHAKAGYSHRGFKVGAALLAWHPYDGWSEYYDHNYKPFKKEEHGVNKRCAERGAIEQAVRAGCSKIIGLVTVSKETSTGSDDSKHNVLLPCEDCRQLFRETPIIDIKTIVYNVHDDSIPQTTAAEMDADPIVSGEPLGPTPIVRLSHFSPLPQNFEVMGEERTMKELLDLYADDLK